MADREQTPPSPPLWHRLWRSPEPEISAAAASGELQVAAVRLLLLSVLLYLPLREYLPAIAYTLVDGSWSVNPMRDPRLVLAVAGGSLFAALMIYSTVQRNRGSSWIGFVSSALDVTLVSGMLLLVLLLGRPEEALDDAVVFPVYFLA
ncbi:MAG TPA: hypothetical protein VEL74_24525, partial [Thermoanaerobaculia bacterium]|nr:hypothetical protein [Thermoanaerobaculia bacterium]